MIATGRPAPGLIDKPARSLCEVKPAPYLQVPRGPDMILPISAADALLLTAPASDAAGWPCVGDAGGPGVIPTARRSTVLS